MAKFLRIPVGATTNSTWTAIAASGNTVCALANAGPFRLARSTDGGLTWTIAGPETSPVFNRAFTHMASDGGQNFVAVASSGATTTIIRSADGGASWVVASSTISSALRCVTFGNSRFVAVGDLGTGWVSTDNGANWTALTMPDSTLNYTSVAWNGSNWLTCNSNNATSGTAFAVGNAAAIASFAYAANGLSGQWVDVVARGTAFWAVTSTGGATGAATINTAGTVYAVQSGLASGSYAGAVSDGTTMVVFSQDGAPFSRITTTGDGISFTVRTITNDAQMWSGGAFSSTNNYVLISRSGGNSNRVLRSTGGVANANWSTSALSYPLTPETNAPLLVNVDDFVTMGPLSQESLLINLNTTNGASDVMTLRFGADTTGVTHEMIMDAIVNDLSAKGAPVGYIDLPQLLDGRTVDTANTIPS